MPRITLITPENFDPYAVPIEDLRIVAVPMLQIIPYNQPGAGSIRLGLGAYFACDVASYDTFSPKQRQDCASRLIALRQQSEALNQNRLLSVLTAAELQRWNRWESEYQANHDSAALPCMNSGINLAAIDCVVSNITGGYTPDNNPQPRTGQVQE